MRMPKRKKEEMKRALQDDGPIYLTKEGLRRLEAKIQRLERNLPSATKEVTRTAEMGDLSENAAYQVAKHKMRRMQGQLLRAKEDLKRIVIIEEGKDTEDVRMGSKVEVKVNGQKREFQIVGPRESDPLKGRISQRSPLGNLLLGQKVGDELILKVDDREIPYIVLAIK